MLLWLEHQFPNQNQKGPRTSQKEKKKEKTHVAPPLPDK